MASKAVFGSGIKRAHAPFEAGVPEEPVSGFGGVKDGAAADELDEAVEVVRWVVIPDEIELALLLDVVVICVLNGVPMIEVEAMAFGSALWTLEGTGSVEVSLATGDENDPVIEFKLGSATIRSALGSTRSIEDAYVKNGENWE